MLTRPIAAAALAASTALAAPAALAEGDACFVSAFTGKVTTLFSDAKAFLGFGDNESKNPPPCGLTEFAELLRDSETKEELHRMVQAKLDSAETDKATVAAEAEPATSCCATASRADAAATAEDPRLDALAKVFGPAVTKTAKVSKAGEAGCAAEAESCPLEAAKEVAAKAESEKAEIDAAALPACCQKKLEAATD